MTHRIERINHLLQEEISELLSRQVKDPRLGNFVAVTAVTTSPDLRNARVYISQLGHEAEKKETMEALRKASGYLRTELARRIRLHRMPELSFLWDDSIEYGSHIEEILDQINREKEK